MICKLTKSTDEEFYFHGWRITHYRMHFHSMAGRAHRPVLSLDNFLRFTSTPFILLTVVETPTSGASLYKFDTNHRIKAWRRDFAGNIIFKVGPLRNIYYISLVLLPRITRVKYIIADINNTNIGRYPCSIFVLPSYTTVIGIYCIHITVGLS
jgi:hypothetical protein